MVKGYKRDFTKFFGLTEETIQKIFYIVMGRYPILVYKQGPTYDIRNAIGKGVEAWIKIASVQAWTHI